MADENPETVRRIYAEELAAELKNRHVCCMALIEDESGKHECSGLLKKVKSDLTSSFISIEDKLPRVKRGKHKLFAFLVAKAANEFISEDIDAGVRAAITRKKRQMNSAKQEPTEPAPKRSKPTTKRK